MMRLGAGKAAIRGLAAALVLIAAEGCSTPYFGTTAATFMRHARDDQDPNLRYLAYAKLASPNIYENDSQRIEATRQLGQALHSGQEPVVSRAVICRTLGEIGRPEAREPLRKAIDDRDPILRAAAARALGKVGGAEDVAILSRVMTADTDPDCRIAAIEGLRGLERPDPHALVVLADGMANTDPAIRLASYEALQTLTGEDLGPEPESWKRLAERANAATAPAAPETRMAERPQPPPG